ncbi:MAG: hypothetical protein H7A32_05285 [Deltaproteobacteria bacterium]|nr:hypothetical protein [Deltaproteobacteria bacterium]
MAQICEITRKRVPHTHNLGEGEQADKLLKRKIEIKEIKDAVRLKVSKQGLERIKQAGGLGKWISQQSEEQLKNNPKFKKLYDRLPESMKPKKQEEEKAEEAEAKE